MSKKDVIAAALKGSDLGSVGVALLEAAKSEARNWGVKK